MRLISWVRVGAARDKDIDRFTSFYADDALLVLPPKSIVRGKDNIQQFWSQSLSRPGCNVIWQPTGLKLLETGDVAVETGKYEMSMSDTSDNPVKHHGQFLTVWKRRANGDWRDLMTTLAEEPTMPAELATQAARDSGRQDLEILLGRIEELLQKSKRDPDNPPREEAQPTKRRPD